MNPYRKGAYYTLGCKLNFSETSAISQELTQQGFAKVNFEEFADIYVINTCSVTDNADKKCRNIVKKALKQNEQAFIVVIGCYAQLKPDEIAQIKGVDLVLGANEKFNIANYLDTIQKKEQTQLAIEAIKETKEFVPGFSLGDRTRSFLKVQDGCDYFCSFCTIPLARGTSRSADVKATLKSAKKVAATDIKEVVLTGVNIGDFGKGTDETFLDLIQELDKIEGIDRFRISSIEPNLLSDEIIQFVAQSIRFVPHFHIPLQSGSNKILKAMRRRYDKQLYQNRIELIKQLMPHCCIGVDVITGFPGETEEDFMETYEFLNQLDISYLHVFTYSERDNTTAIKMVDVVPQQERNKRSKMLRILSSKKKRAFYEQNAGKTAKVLFEHEQHENDMYGFTENYVKVKAPFNKTWTNQIKTVKITSFSNDGNMNMELIEDKCMSL